MPKMPKNHPKFTQNRKTLVYVLNRGIWRCLKRARDIGTKAMLSDVKTAFRWNSALIKVLFLSSFLPTTVLRDNERDRARDIYVFGIAYSVRSVYCELEVSFARKTEENQDIQVLVSKGSLNLNFVVFMNV